MKKRCINFYLLCFLLLSIFFLSTVIWAGTTPTIAVITFESNEKTNMVEQYRSELELNLLNVGRFKVIEKDEWAKTWSGLNLPFSPSALTGNPKLSQVKGVDYLLTGTWNSTPEPGSLTLRLLELPTGKVKQTFIWRAADEKWTLFLTRFWGLLKNSFLLKGTIVKVDGKKVYLSEEISADYGVFPGDTYLVQRKQAIELPGGQQLGTELIDIAKIKIAQVYDKFSVAEVIDKKDEVKSGDLVQEVTFQEGTNAVNQTTETLSNQLLAFCSNREGNFEIYLYDEKGNHKNLTQNPAFDLAPTWGPGQEEIAFSSNRENGYAIYALNLKTNVTRRITPPEGYIYPVWSPDGKSIAFLSNKKGNEANLYIINPDGTGMKCLASKINSSALNWSHDSKYLTFSSLRSSFSMATDIFTLNVASGDIQNLTKDDSTDVFPVWSPDQNKIAYVSNKDGAYNLYYIEPRTMIIGRVTENLQFTTVNGLTWSPDGKSVIISCSYKGINYLYQVYLSDGTVKTLLESTFLEILPAWTR